MERHKLALFDDLARKRKKSCSQIHKSLIRNLFRHHKYLRGVSRCPTCWLANTFRKFFTKEGLTGCPNKSRLNSTDLKWAASHGKRAGHGSRGFGTNLQCPAFDRRPTAGIQLDGIPAPGCKSGYLLLVSSFGQTRRALPVEAGRKSSFEFWAMHPMASPASLPRRRMDLWTHGRHALVDIPFAAQAKDRTLMIGAGGFRLPVTPRGRGCRYGCR